MSEPFAPILDPARVAHFKCRGTLSIDAITTEDETRWLRGNHDEIVEDESALELRYEHTREDGFSGIITQIFLPERQCPKLLETSYVASAPWHQDEAYFEFPTQRCHGLSVWMSLDGATVDSGCMQFIPGSPQGTEHESDSRRALTTIFHGPRTLWQQPLMPTRIAGP